MTNKSNKNSNTSKQSSYKSKANNYGNNYNNEYSIYGLPFHGEIINRDLYFPNSRSLSNQQFVSLKNIINPRYNPNNSFGNYTNEYWYPLKYIDTRYNPQIAYTNANGPNGPYFATTQINYPRSMYKKVNYGKNKSKK